MGSALGISSNAANCLLGHGQVQLDGRTLGCDERTWQIDDLRGRMLKAGRMEGRLYGSRRIDDTDPRRLPPLCEANSQLALGEL